MEIGNVAFKAFLYKDKTSETHEEVRWFHVEQNAVVSLDLVKEKLVSTFPRLVDNEFTLYWKDCDDDLVLISTDTELLIALTNITSEPRRLYIYLEPPQKPQNNPSNSNDIHHIGVVCDGCGGEVYGFRYKCIECPDFDLCSRCESNGIHSEHCFLRLTDFTATRRLRKCLSAGRKIFKHCDREAGKHGKRHGGHGRHGWYELLSQFVTDINSPYNTDETKNESNNKDNEKAESRAQTEASKGSKCPFMAPRGSADTQNKEGDCHVSYLKNIGQTIASLLDPLGIDVDVEVRTKNKSDQKMETESNEPKPSTSNTGKNEKPVDTNDNMNRAVPVFPPDYVPIYMDTNVHTPIVSAFVNGQPVDVNVNGQSASSKSEGATNAEPQVKVGMSAFVNGVPVFSTSTPNSTSNTEPQTTNTPLEPSKKTENSKDKKNETESGWTIIDDSESSTSSEDNSNASDKQNVGDGDSTHNKSAKPATEQVQNNQPSEPQPMYPGMYPNIGQGFMGMPHTYSVPPHFMPGMAPNMPGMNPNMNQNQNMPNMSQNPNMPNMPGMAQGFPGFMQGMAQSFPGMPNYAPGQNYPGMQAQGPNPNVPMPGFNFDNMARELHRHLQTHFKDAMSAASNIASNVATNTVSSMSNSRPPSANNSGTNGNLQNDDSNANETTSKKV